MSINIHKFLDLFHHYYCDLYTGALHVSAFEYDDAVAAFDRFLEKHSAFVSDFCKFRGDYITSDREAAAFIFALDEITA